MSTIYLAHFHFDKNVIILIWQKSYFEFILHFDSLSYIFTFICFSYSGAPKKIRIEEEDQEYIGKSMENAYDYNGYYILYVEYVSIFEHEIIHSILIFRSALFCYYHRLYHHH